MPINKEVYTVGVLVIQYAFPLCSIVFVYSRIASRMSSRFTTQNSKHISTTSNNNTRIILTNATRITVPNNNCQYNQLPQYAQEQRRK